MKIAISAQGRELSSPVDPRFGRAAYFIIYEMESGAMEAVKENAGENII